MTDPKPSPTTREVIEGVIHELDYREDCRHARDVLQALLEGGVAEERDWWMARGYNMGAEQMRERCYSLADALGQHGLAAEIRNLPLRGEE